jgi:hypothetical protein
MSEQLDQKVVTKALETSKLELKDIVKNDGF